MLTINWIRILLWASIGAGMFELFKQTEFQVTWDISVHTNTFYSTGGNIFFSIVFIIVQQKIFYIKYFKKCLIFFDIFDKNWIFIPV